METFNLMQKNTMEIEQFCKEMPKVELHAHLNGSLSPKTLEILGCTEEEVAEYQKLTTLLERREKGLSECFKLFSIAHQATNDKNSIYLATKQVIQEFYEDNVIYLELRTTPRSVDGMTKKDYIEIVVQAIQDNTNDIIVKLILSIDRRHDFKSSEDSVKLFIEMKEIFPDIIRGIDLSGDPNSGCFNANLFRLARKAQLYVTIHCAEVDSNPNEISDILKFQPYRLGHATFLHPNYSKKSNIWDMYCAKPIPAEFCPTSNVLCGTSEGYKEHHVKEWLKNNLPFSIGTDDKGVFNTSLSKELFHVATSFNLTAKDLLGITYSSILYSFAADVEKADMTNKVKNWEMKCNL